MAIWEQVPVLHPDSGDFEVNTWPLQNCLASGVFALVVGANVSRLKGLLCIDHVTTRIDSAVTAIIKPLLR